MRSVINRIDKSLLTVENTLVITIVYVMVIMAFLQVVLRNLFSMGILWGDIFLRHLVLWVGFIGASLATRQEKHISIDALSRLLKKEQLPYVKVIIHFVTMTVCFVLANAGYRFLAFEIDAETILFNDVPAWIFQIIIPFGFDLIGLRFLLKIIEGLLNIFQERQSVEEDLGFNWGAFSLAGIWLLFHKRFLNAMMAFGLYGVLWYASTFFEPPFLYMLILTALLVLLYFGAAGNYWVWQRYELSSIEALRTRERLWNTAGILIAVAIAAWLIYYRFFYVISTDI